MIQLLNKTEIREITGGSQATYAIGQQARKLFDNILIFALFL